MSTLLVDLKGNRYLNKTLFIHHLYVYDDKIVFRKRGIIKIHEFTMSYNHIAQANLSRGLFFASLEIINSGGYENILIKHVPKKPAAKAKKIIDQKIYHIHAKPTPKANQTDDEIHKLEMSLSRLTELLHKGRITKREYNKKRKNLLKSH